MGCTEIVWLAVVFLSVCLAFGSDNPVSVKVYRENLRSTLEQCENKGDIDRVIESERTLYNSLLKECEVLNGVPSPAANTTKNIDDAPECQHKVG